MNQNTERNKSTSPSIQQPSPLSTESSSARQRAPSYPNGITFSPTLTESQHKYLTYLEKRSAHNALERQRREGLNSKFQELAHVLPSLQQVKRPSKSMIVAKSLEFVSTATKRESEYRDELLALRKENAQLLRQASLCKKRRKEAIDQSRQSDAKQSVDSVLTPIIKSKSSAGKLKPQICEPSSSATPPPSPSHLTKRKGSTDESVQEDQEPDKKKHKAQVSCHAGDTSRRSSASSSATAPTTTQQYNQFHMMHNSYSPIMADFSQNLVYTSSPPEPHIVPLNTNSFVSSIPAVRTPVVNIGNQPEQQQQQQQMQPIYDVNLFEIFSPIMQDASFDDLPYPWEY
ncbi:hypothetical protein G6F70_002573 [Rhizopus microsporus]|nr:hypothetical protein G6F71_005461 [Rhizopus microsporus]KAG1202083.1 hypothetical protein G6F70_002573 [Rhizopus microsporus]KAG1210300.1 hypothetical protein G6F69_005590 [Rhizopus microsporus]KAG1232054.1 hypothetical protein G6F67_005288 [Rhizopus microsporus]KAG1264271.1 hypothetical protein G6F68_004474 [Rhizopus microsporus]